MSSNRILSLSLRPKNLHEYFGQEDLVTLLENQFNSGRIPHFYILHGHTGSGKTTLARILALALQQDPALGEARLNLSEDTWKSYKSFEIREINSANQNGIDDIRAIVESMRYKPIPPSRARVLIMDEAHQITSAAQNVLLTETEDVASHVYYIFCTSNISKIIPALQRRAYILSPKPLPNYSIKELLQKAADVSESEEDIAPLHKILVENGVSSPGLILQAAEKYFNGMPPEESVFQTDISNLDTMAICRAIASGSWKDAANFLKSMGKTDIIMVKLAVLGYLKAVLLKASGNRAINLAKAIKSIGDDNGNDSIPMFLANLCIGCDFIATH
jgi:DNA polymerase III delta prime subunit